MTEYRHDKNFPIRTFDVEYLSHGSETFLARVYQPQDQGPFPMLVYVHGGAWSGGARTSGELIMGHLAASGLIVFAPDFRLAPDHPYPAQVTDVHFATRWLKSHAQELDGDALHLGSIGASSGGHTLLLSAMRPFDPRYSALPLHSAESVDARLRYALTLCPVIDPYARLEFQRKTPSAGGGRPTARDG